jgi:hypothetical protein
MTDLPGGNARTSPMAGTLAGYNEDMRLALRVLLHDRGNLFTRPRDRTALDEKFFRQAREALKKVRDADLAAARSDEKLIRGLRADLAFAVAERETLNVKITGLEEDRARMIAEAEAQNRLLQEDADQLRDQRDAHLCEPLPLRQKPAPEVTLKAPAPPVAPTMAPDGPTIDGDGPSGVVRSPGKGKPAAKRTGRPGGSV